MAMAPDHSLLLLIVAVSIVSTAHSVAGADDNIAKACSGMAYETLCVETLTSMPESSTASDPRRAAELAYQYVLKEGKELTSELDKALAAPKDKGDVHCLKTTESDLKTYVAQVEKAAPEKDFDGARDVFFQMLYEPPATFGCDSIKDKEPIIGKVFTYENRLQVTSDLFNKACPLAPPPAEE